MPVLGGPTLVETPINAIFNAEDFDLPSVNKYIHSVQLDFLETLNLVTGSKTAVLSYRVDEQSNWVVCKTFSGVNASQYRGEMDVAIPSTRQIYFKLVIDGANIKFKSMTIFYIIQPPYRNQWNLMLNPASNSLDVPGSYAASYLSTIQALRDSQAIFPFVDFDGTTFDCILDSFNFRVIPTFNPAGATPDEAQITLVLREV